MTKFPVWLPLKELSYIIKVLSEYGDTRLVGGCVREILSRRVSADIDLATQVQPSEVMKVLNEHNIKCIPTGLKHGTVTVVLNGHVFEITTLRHDIETYGRHAKVRFTDDWLEDAKRRDFTFNAMYMDLEGKVYDYFGGAKDLKNKIIIFIGNPEDRIREDYLRIIRYFRFYSYLGGDNIDKPSLGACKKLLDGLKILSGERINNEMIKILSAKYAKESLLIMDRIGLFPHIALKKLQSFSKLKLSKAPIPNLAAVIISSGFTYDEFLKLAERWKFSKLQRITLDKLCFQGYLKFLNPSHKIFIYRYGYELYEFAVTLHNIIYPNEKTSKVKNWQLPVFPISGNDLHALEITGKELGETLKKLENKWLESKFKLNKEELLQMLE